MAELQNTLLTGLLYLQELSNNGTAEFFKNMGMGMVTDIAKDTLKNLGGKVLSYFKGKKEEDTLDALESAINKQDVEKFKAKSESVLELLKIAVENDANFRKEVEDVLNELGDDSKKKLLENAGTLVKNISKINGANNKVYQGISHSTITDNSLNINQKNKEGDNIIGADFLEKWVKKDK